MQTLSLPKESPNPGCGTCEWAPRMETSSWVLPSNSAKSRPPAADPWGALAGWGGQQCAA
eukprot:3486335-Amphidinium_carterae.1